MLCSLIRLRRYASTSLLLPLNLTNRFSSTSSAATVAAAMVAHAKDDAYLTTTIPKRIRLFEAIQTEQRTRLLSLSPEPIKITLPDGSVKEGKMWQTTPLDIAREISKNLANNALISKVDDQLWDMTRPLEHDCKLQIFKFDDDEGRDTFWHSSAHILGESLETEYGCKLCIGPCTTRGEGFYYDAFYGDLGLNDEHFKQIEAVALKAVAEKQPFERIEVTREQALEIFSDNKFKVEIINDLPPGKITVYRCGPLVDLCRGPHIPNTSFVKAIACLKASSAYWRGDKDRESLQRVYGISYPDQKSLKEYLFRLEEAKKYDHRILGVKQELILHHEWSPGSWFFLPHGARIYNKLMDFIRNQYRDRGYQEVISPNVFNMDLWVQSGHAANYKEDMFVLEVCSMATMFSFIDQIVAGRVDWSLKVRVMNLWHVPVKNTPHDIQTIEMVLIDEKNNKIGATVQKSWIPLFIHLIEEGGTYLIQNVTVAQNDMSYKKTTHKFKLNFIRTTRVCRINAEDIPLFSFDFTDFPTILAEQRVDMIVDVIGHIVQKDTLKEKEKDGRRSILLDLVLEDPSKNRVNCTLWGPHATRMHAYLEGQSSPRANGPVVIIIQLARLTNFLGVNAVSTGFHGTKLFINDALPEIVQYRSSLSADQAGPSQVVEPIVNPTAVSLHDEMLDTPLMTIADLIEAKKECLGAVLVTVVDINTEKGWSYNSCNKCLKVVSKVDNRFYCDSCRGNVTASPRFKLHLQVIDTTGSTTFTLFNSLVVSFIGRSAEDLIGEAEQGNNHDDIPAEFNSFFGKTFLFKVQVADINIKRGWQTYTAKKFTTEDSIISEFLSKHNIQMPHDGPDSELQNDLAKLEEDNIVILLDNDTPTKPPSEPISMDITPKGHHVAKTPVSSLEALDISAQNHSPQSAEMVHPKIPKKEFKQPNPTAILDPKSRNEAISNAMSSEITPPTIKAAKRGVSAMEPLDLSDMEESPESLTKMAKNATQEKYKE